MISEIITAISICINRSFGESYSIYKDKVEQGFKTPGFYIKCLSPGSKTSGVARETYAFDFDIHYFTASENVQTDCTETGLRLLEDLSAIVLPDGTRLAGKSMKFSIVDDVLHFFVTYKRMVRKAPSDVDMMETVEAQIKEQ